MPLLCTYSNALRCIGQALETSDIEDFDLKYYSGEFRLECGDPIPPYLKLIQLRYALDDIKSLERKGQARRAGPGKSVSFDSLSEVLRTLGGYVDKRGGRLLRICSSDSSLTQGSVKLEYQTGNRLLHVEEFSMTSIYETIARMYRDRSDASRRSHVFEGPTVRDVGKFNL
jgi:hypothetical protein